MKIKAPSSQFVLPPEGEHLATLVDWKDLGEQPDPFNEGETKLKLKFVYEMPDGTRQYEFLTQSLHPMSKLYEHATMLLGHNPPDELELNDLVGCQAMITIEHKPGKAGKMRSYIVNIRRALSKEKAKNAQKKANPETEFETSTL